MKQKFLDRLPSFAGKLGDVLRYAMVLLAIFDTAVIVVSFLDNHYIYHEMQNTQLEQRFFSDLKDAECGQRGYLLTLDEGYLPQYYVGASQARADLAVLDVYLSDEPKSHPIYLQLQSTAKAKLTEMDKTVGLARAGHLDAAVAIVKNNVGMEMTEQIRNYVNILRAQERDRIRQHRILF